ncbi:MAG: SIS domain-containing protein [Clostridiaceae bacterium]|jgi:tagatose-6-phosphate ketose/aldose isomerase|nr:SIS domain-containing protein [Clostridiaceae bacterium]
MTFNMTPYEMQNRSCQATATEIHQQPGTWYQTLNQLNPLFKALKSWIKTITDQADFDVIFTGAGSSEYVGNALYVSLNPVLGYHARSFASTAIVASPQYYLSKTKPTLLVSFARSGNSPESLGAVQAADAYCTKLQHLFITCNKDGALAGMAEGRTDCRSIVLADETNDRSFAMTSSFTNMYLAALSIFGDRPAEELLAAMDQIISGAEDFLEKAYATTENLVSEFAFERIVYLGTGPLKGFAQESALKMLELTAGKVAALFDSPMGFRHGPKSIVNDTTLTVLFLSDEPAVRRYEMDLLKELSSQRKKNRILAVSSWKDSQAAALCDSFISFDNDEKLPSAYLGLQYVLIAQCIALFKSLSYGIGPDNPCPSGEVNRVVKGVSLYPVEV